MIVAYPRSPRTLASGLRLTLPMQQLLRAASAEPAKLSELCVRAERKADVPAHQGAIDLCDAGLFRRDEVRRGAAYALTRLGEEALDELFELARREMREMKGER